MSDGLNKVTLLGNLGADPELRFTAAGQPVLNIRIATTETYLDKDKMRRERTDWHNVTIWGKRGEALAKILRKGSSVFIEGSLRTSSYDDREGVKRYKTEVNATNVILSGSRPSSGAEPRAPGGQASASSPANPARAAVPAVASADEGGGYGGGSDDDIPF